MCQSEGLKNVLKTSYFPSFKIIYLVSNRLKKLILVCDIENKRAEVPVYILIK